MLSSREQWELLRAYADHQDDEAFARLVAEYIDLVHSAAMRQVRDRQLAEDVCQGVFMLLANKAGGMGSDVILPAYLLKATYFISRNTLRRETRRRMYERRAAEVVTRSMPNDIRSNVADVLDEGMSALNDRERAAIVLRFFEQRSLAEAGEVLGVSEDAAAMRVSRALSKMRQFFASRNIRLESAEVGMILLAVSVRSAPAGVEGAVVHGSLCGGSDTGLPMGDIIRDAGHEMLCERVKFAAMWSASAAVIVLATGMLVHLAYMFSRPIARPPVDVW